MEYEPDKRLTKHIRQLKKAKVCGIPFAIEGMCSGASLGTPLSGFQLGVLGMGQIIWRIKEAIGKLIVFGVIGLVVYGGYSLYRKGAFRGGVAHASRVVLRQIPYFGSRFRHFIASSSGSRHSVSNSGRHYRRARTGKNVRKYSPTQRKIRRHRRH